MKKAVSLKVDIDIWKQARIQALKEDMQLNEWIEKIISSRHTVNEAIELGLRYGCIDGDHHKMWVIDQMIRILAGGRYDALILESNKGEDGPDTYEWEVGIPP